MAFDSIFQGPPEGENAPGTAQSPSLGVDVVNKELYISSGEGWEELNASSGGTPASPNTSVQFNNSGAFGGNSLLTYDIDQSQLLIGLQSSQLSAYAQQEVFPNYTGSNLVVAEQNDTTDPYASTTLLVSDFTSDTTNDTYTNLTSYCFTDVSSGTIKSVLAADCENYITGTGTVSEGASAIDTYCQYDGTGTVAIFAGLYAYGNEVNSGTVTNIAGIWSEDQCATSATNSYGIHLANQTTGTNKWAIKTGTGLVEFGDNVKFDALIQSGIVYSAAGTPLPSAATAGIGARAFVSDATANVYGTNYASGGSINAPVYSDGTNWNMG